MGFGVADVEAAAARITGRVHVTPVLRSRLVDAAAGCRVLMKAENLQRTGSFKARGAFNALLSLDDEVRARGVLAVSSGNHAQAVALAARELGVAATVVMPSDATPVKVEATRGYGAEVVQHGVTAENREEVVLGMSRDRGIVLVHPFDDHRVMAGQGTLGLELAEQVEAVEVVVVPVGGGGLISGVATAVKARWPGVRVVGVEPSGADDARRSLEAGERVALDGPPDTVVDGVRSPVVGERPWEVIRRLVDEIVTVTDTETVVAMELLWTRAKTVVEPAGAMPLAAIVTGRVRAASAAVVLSGGNVDLELWRSFRG